MNENETQFNDKESIEDDYFDHQDLRVINVLAPGLEKELDDLPEVNKKTVKKYYDFLEEKLNKGLLLTGYQSLGYFSWEERFEWEHGSESEHKKLRKTQASCQDKYEFVELKLEPSSEKILANVLRMNDKKNFNIPLEDLEVCDKGKNNENRQLLKDFSYWYENFHL